MGSIFEKIYEEVKKIPKGKTATYGEIAKRVNTSPRIVGFALHRNPDPFTIPCHRIVFKDGSCSSSYAFGGRAVQEKKLREEATSDCDESSPYESDLLLLKALEDSPKRSEKKE